MLRKHQTDEQIVTDLLELFNDADAPDFTQRLTFIMSHARALHRDPKTLLFHQLRELAVNVTLSLADEVAFMAGDASMKSVDMLLKARRVLELGADFQQIDAVSNGLLTKALE